MLLIRAITEQNRFIESTKKQKINEENTLNVIGGIEERSYDLLENDGNSYRNSSGSIMYDTNNKKLGKSDKEDNAVKMPIFNTKKSLQETTTEENFEGKLVR